MEIYVIRHGFSEGNQAGVIQGYADSPLSSIGMAQASILGRYFRLREISPDIIHCSALKRAHQTAQLIAQELDPVPEVIPCRGLMEVDVGSAAGMSVEEAHAKFPEQWAIDINRFLDFSLFGGETMEQFYERVIAATLDIMAGWDDLLADRTVMFVSHAGSMRPLLKALLDAEGDLMYYTFGNCCHVKIEYRPIREHVRKVFCELLRLETVASILGVPDPHGDFDDSVGSKIG